MWREPTTGFAIGGYDPVSYFGPNGPVSGRGPFEFSDGEVVWRFRNQGNLDAFRRDPNIYTPQFGGYGAFGMLQGRLVDPNPEIWLLEGGRVLLFQTRESRDRWRQQREPEKSRAMIRWRRASEKRKDVSNTSARPKP